jgi:hypothetical protein
VSNSFEDVTTASRCWKSVKMPKRAWTAVPEVGI